MLLSLVGVRSTLALEAIRDDIVITTLDNDLTVILAPKANAPVATVDVWIGVGSVHEPPELNGIAHFFEHMIFKGSTRFPDVDALVEGWGGATNAATSFDFTHYYVSVPKEHVTPAIDLMADILLNGQFLETDLDRERDVVLREGDQRYDNPDTWLFYQVWNAYYGDHPYAQPILGTEETVSRITRDDFLAWLDTYYVPNNMTIIVSGGIDPDRILSQIRKVFGAMEARELPLLDPAPIPSRMEVEEVFLPRAVEQERLYMAWPAPSVAEFDDVVAMDVLLSVLSGNRSSRIYRNVIRDLGVVTDADAFYFTTRLPAIYVMSAQYPLGRTGVARRALLHEMQRILDGHLTQAEVETAKTVLIADLEQAVESSVGLADHLGFYATVVGDPLAIFDYVAGIHTVTAEDVINVSRRYIEPGTQMEFRLAPATARAIRPALSEGVLTLDNGLRLILREDPTTNVVAFQTFVGTGTAVETAVQAGISSFTNTLLLRGTDSRSEEEIFSVIENLGASLSQSQLPDMANIALVATADTWPEALPVYLEVLTRPAFAPAEFERLQRETLRQIEAQVDDDWATVYAQLLRNLYGDDGYGHPNLGTMEAMSALTQADVEAFYARYYVPANMLITVVGNMDAELMAARLGTSLGQLDTDETPAVATVSRLLERAEPLTVTTERAGTGITWLAIGFPGPSIADPDYAAMKVLNSIIGSGSSSRMYTIIRDQQGLAYSTGSFFPSRAGQSHLAVYAIVVPAAREAVVDDIRALLQDIRDNGITAEELALAIRREVGNFILGHETAADRAFDLGWYAMLGAGPDVATDYPARVRAVTVEDVQRVAVAYLDSYVVSVLQPPQ